MPDARLTGAVVWPGSGGTTQAFSVSKRLASRTDLKGIRCVSG